MKKTTRIELTNIETISDYVEERILRAAHHARPVLYAINDALACLITYGKELKTRMKECKAYGNCVWFKLGSNDYCLAYNHTIKKIELRENNLKGKVIGEWNNKNSREMIFLFRNLNKK